MEYVNLDQIADILNGYNFKSANYVTDGIRVIRITNVQQGYLEDKDPVFYDYSKDLDRYLLKEKDLLMSLTGNVGRVGMVVSSLLPAGLNQRVACIRCKNESFNIEFLFYFFNNELFRNKAISNSNGVAQLNLSTEWLKKVKVPVYDGENQQKIVEEFDNITFLINENKNILVNLDNIVKSQFIEMFGDPGVTTDGHTFGESAKKLIRGPFGSSLKKEFFVPKGANTFKVYEQKHAIEDREDIGSYYIDYPRYQSLKRFSVEPGDIIMSCSGTIGRTHKITNDSEKGVINQALLLIKLNEAICNETFFMKQMSYILDNLSTSGSAIVNISSIKILEKMNFLLPPIELQNKFADFVQLIDKSKFIVQKQIKLLEELLEKKMNEYFGN